MYFNNWQYNCSLAIGKHILKLNIFLFCILPSANRSVLLDYAKITHRILDTITLIKYTLFKVRLCIRENSNDLTVIYVVQGR